MVGYRLCRWQWIALKRYFLPAQPAKFSLSSISKSLPSLRVFPARNCDRSAVYNSPTKLKSTAQVTASHTLSSALEVCMPEAFGSGHPEPLWPKLYIGVPWVPAEGLSSPSCQQHLQGYFDFLCMPNCLYATHQLQLARSARSPKSFCCGSDCGLALAWAIHRTSMSSESLKLYLLMRTNHSKEVCPSLDVLLHQII